jgi:antitoxin PrlF
MTYSATITSKGQITIPKKLREVLDLQEGKKILFHLEKGQKAIHITAAPDILELAGTFQVRRKVDPIKAREYMEQNYERA